MDQNLEMEERRTRARQELAQGSREQNQILAGKNDTRARFSALEEDFGKRPADQGEQVLAEFEEIYEKMLVEIPDQHGISDENRGDLRRTVEALAVDVRARVHRGVWAKEVDAGRAKTEGELRTLLSEIADPSLTPEAREAKINDGRITIEAGELALWYGAEQARNIKTTFEQSADRALARAVINRNPLNAPDFIEDPENLIYLPEPEVQTLLAQAIREKRRVEAEIASEGMRAFRAEQVILNERIGDFLHDVLVNGPPGVGREGEAMEIAENPIDEARRNPLYTPDQLDRLDAQFEINKDGFFIHEQLRYADPVQTAALLEAFRPKEGAIEFRHHNSSYGTLVSFAVEVQKARAKDPNQYAESLLVLAGNQDTGEARIRANLETQQSMGIPPHKWRVVSDGQAEDIVLQYKDAKTGTAKAAMLAQVSQQWGIYGQSALEEMYERTNGLPENARLMLHAGPITRSKLADTEGMTENQLAEGMSDTDRTDLAKDFDDGFDDKFGQTINPRRFDIKNNLRSIGRRITLFNAQTGVEDPAETALTELFESQYEFNGTLRVPRGIEMGTVQGHGNRVVEALEGVPLETGVESADAFQDRIEDDGNWYINNDETGAILFLDGVAVTTAEGVQIEFLFAEAAGPAPIGFSPETNPFMDRPAGDPRVGGGSFSFAGFGKSVNEALQVPIEAAEALLERMEKARENTITGTVQPFIEK
ncbi:MAG: hypothetical protein V3W44_08565 [Dehalococcoidales bacterium]